MLSHRELVEGEGCEGVKRREGGLGFCLRTETAERGLGFGRGVGQCRVFRSEAAVKDPCLIQTKMPMRAAQQWIRRQR